MFWFEVIPRYSYKMNRKTANCKINKVNVIFLMLIVKSSAQWRQQWKYSLRFTFNCDIRISTSITDQPTTSCFFVHPDDNTCKKDVCWVETSKILAASVTLLVSQPTNQLVGQSAYQLVSQSVSLPVSQLVS